MGGGRLDRNEETALNNAASASAKCPNEVYALWVNAGWLEAWSGGKPEAIAKQAAFPSVVALPGGGFLAAWEAGGSIGMKKLPGTTLRLPVQNAQTRKCAEGRPDLVFWG